MAKPEIRLKGFKGEWEEKTFSQIVNVNSGMDYKGLNAGNIPVYGTGGYMLSVDKSLSNEDAIGIGRKGTIDSPQLLKAPFWTIDTLFFMTLKKGYDLNFIYSLCQTVRWKDYDESTGVPSLSKNNIDRIESFVPNISEQKCIANYFKSLDSMIQGVTKKIASLKQMKQACLVSMFPQAGETKPRVRFKGFKGEWEEKRLSDCLDISTERNFDNKFGKEDVLSVSDDFGVMNQIELLGRSYAGKSVSNYGILKTGEIVYTKSPLKSKPFGIVKQNTGKTGIVSVLYAVYMAKEGTAADYIHYYFDPDWRLNDYLRPLVNKGAKNTMNISDEMALTGYIMIPKDINEQLKIASYFRSLDKQISLQEARLEKLKQIKAACLDKMFV